MQHLVLCNTKYYELHQFIDQHLAQHLLRKGRFIMKHWLLFLGILLGFITNIHAQKHVDANAYTQHPAEYNNQVVKISNIILIKPSSHDEFYAVQFRECPKGYTPVSIQFPDLGYRGRFMIHQNLAGTFVENQHIIADVVIEVNLNGPSMFSVVTYVEPHR